MKQVIYKSNDRWYITTEKNYFSYVQNARAIHEIHDVKTLQDISDFIDRWCVLYGDNHDDFTIIQ